MISFLEEQIRRIFNHHKDDIGDVSIIIPNRRAAVYIQKYLAKAFQAAYFSPEILTIHDWINQNTDQKILTSTELLFILHGVHQEIEGEKAEDFEKFMLWGKTILTDFDEIDRYMKSPDEVFRNLKEIKKLEYWDVDIQDMGEAQAQFHNIWGKLGDYHEKLNKRLTAINCTYSGRAYLNFFNDIEQLKLKSKTYFLGFNAVSEVEKSIIKKLVDLKKGEAKFDIDRYYYENENHEAGYFYRQICKDWQIKPELSNQFEEVPKYIEVIETAQQVGQAKIAGALVKKLIAEGEQKKDIALVLADESLLIPLSRSLPEDVETANITMGWPLKFSHLKGFLDIIFDFQFNFEKFNSGQLYHKTLVNFLQHPYAHEILNDTAIKEKVQNKITESNQIFVELELLDDISPEFQNLALVLTPWPKENHNRLKVMDQLVEILYTEFRTNEKRKMDLEIIYQFNEGLKKFKTILVAHNIPLSLRAFKMLFFQFWQNESLSFYGNPIDGLQLMGILETRTLDFKNLVIVGMNEGNLPKSTQTNSFIPRDLRLHLGMPTEEDRQSIFAHHFYRLLHRASNVYMTYNSGTESMGSHERSRYITQLENELDRAIHKFETKTYVGEDQKANISETVYTSTPEVHKRLDILLEKGLSPSAVNKLITCPLDFYYRYILKFDEKDEVEENIESSTFGTKIHTVLQRIIEDNFKTEVGFLPMTIEALEKENTVKKIEERLLAAYLEDDGGKKFKAADLKYGQNKLSFDVSRNFIGSFLNQQIAELKSSTDAVIPIDLEKEIDAEIRWKLEGVERVLRLRGTADRIDKMGTVHRILDYKSGKSEQGNVSLPGKSAKEDWMTIMMNHKDKGHARQLLMYGLMFRHSFPKTRPFKAGIISMIKLSDWIHHITYKGEEELSDQLLDLFQEELVTLIRELYSPEFEFKHHPESKYCQHCGK